MTLMRENPFRGPLEGWALKIETFFGPATSEASAICSQKVIKSNKHLIKSRYNSYFMYMSFCILCSVFCILLCIL